MRTVVDTNLIISGLLWGGSPSLLMDAVRDGQLDLVLSPELYLELEEVLNRDKFASRITARGLTPAGLLSAVSAVAEMIVPDHLALPSSLRDPDDLAVLECAVTACAEAIITGDMDLLVMGEFQGVPIMDVRTALQRMGISVE